MRECANRMWTSQGWALFKYLYGRKKLLSYHNDQAIKDKYVQRMKDHIAAFAAAHAAAYDAVRQKTFDYFADQLLILLKECN